MKKTKIYIAGPMTGLINFNYQSFDVAQIWLESKGYEVRNPATFQHGWNSYKDYIKAGLCMLEMCDRIVFLPGWESSKGAILEKEKAIELRIKMLNPFDEHIFSVLFDIYEAAKK